MSVDVDDLDQKILDLLSEDGRLSYAEIGRKLNLSRVSVRERVTRLIDTGVIERFSVIINPAKVGFNLAAFFEIAVHPNQLHEVAKTLADNKFVLSINQMTGPSTLHVHASLRDNNHLQNFMKDAIYNLPGINSVSSYVLLRGFKSKRGGIKIGT
ncbi:MAG: AsnC family transcriptional regulator [Clostridiaceae bacterium BRH_c20a]|nr:MAG: AsnC family transcriptional regulator [Clostridiaceae bacterium BRH_c20a]